MSSAVDTARPVPDVTAACLPVVTLDNVGLRRDRRVILQDVNLTINRGDFVAVTGPNGGGKTTLLRLILGLIKPTTGTVTVERGITIGYLPQKNMIDSHFPVSVREVVESGLLNTKAIGRDERRRMVEVVIERIGMADHATRPIGELSGGQLQRTLLGRAIISKPRLLVLDEPLSYIDKRFEERLYTLVAELAREATVILVSHEMSRIASMASRHLIVDGRLHQCSAHHHYVAPECM